MESPWLGEWKQAPYTNPFLANNFRAPFSQFSGTKLFPPSQVKTAQEPRPGGGLISTRRKHFVCVLGSWGQIFWPFKHKTTWLWGLFCNVRNFGESHAYHMAFANFALGLLHWSNLPRKHENTFLNYTLLCNTFIHAICITECCLPFGWMLHCTTLCITEMYSELRSKARHLGGST